MTVCTSPVLPAPVPSPWSVVQSSPSLRCPGGTWSGQTAPHLWLFSDRGDRAVTCLSGASHEVKRQTTDNSWFFFLKKKKRRVHSVKAGVREISKSKKKIPKACLRGCHVFWNEDSVYQLCGIWDSCFVKLGRVWPEISFTAGSSCLIFFLQLILSVECDKTVKSIGVKSVYYHRWQEKTTYCLFWMNQ